MSAQCSPMSLSGHRTSTRFPIWIPIIFIIVIVAFGVNALLAESAETVTLTRQKVGVATVTIELTPTASGCSGKGTITPEFFMPEMSVFGEFKACDTEAQKEMVQKLAGIIQSLANRQGEFPGYRQYLQFLQEIFWSIK